jgi:hypothetical protein
MAECDVCGDTTGTHKQFCGEGSGRDDVLAVAREMTNGDDTSVFVHHTGGGCMTIVCMLTDRPPTDYGFPELWITNVGGTKVAPDRDDPSDGWMLGLYPNAEDSAAGMEATALVETTDQSLDGLRDAFRRILAP